MIDADAFARLLCDWCLELEPDQQVLIATSTLAEPLVLALHRAALERQAWPLLRLTPPQLTEDFYRYADPRHLDSYPPLELTEVESIDAWVRIDAPANTRALSGVAPSQLARASRARAAIQEARLRLRWCATLWPTPALAQQAGLSQADYSEFVSRALFLDQPDPVAAWAELSRRQQSLVDRLSAAQEIRIQAPGTDLRLRVDGRTWINSDGRRNMPSGEVFTGPLEDSAEGRIRFDIPSSPRGVEVQGVELTFSGGRVVAARADRGEDYLLAALETDPGARLVGELGIGTNPGIDRSTGSILLDEKIAGTVHLALGRSYPETGGRNQSALHWDLICDLRPGGRSGESGGRLTADGEPIDPLSSQ